MLIYLLYIFSFLAIIILYGIFILFCIWSIGIFKSKVPFVPVPASILEDIQKNLEINDDSIVYDLGCGDGRVLFFLAKQHPKTKFIGLENMLFPILLARIEKWQRRKTSNNIKLLKQDFFKKDLSGATHVFTYLYPNIMDDLLPKLEKELKPGTKLVSVTFKFTTKRSVGEIDLNRDKRQLARKLYIYVF